MKAFIEFVKGWRMQGEPWSMYLFVPTVGALVIVAMVFFICTIYPMMRLLGLSDKEIWD